MESSSSHRHSSRSTYNSSVPLTPRAFSGHYSSPGSSLHQSEDPVVLELDSRRLRAGFANEAVPRCEIIYTEELWRKVGEKVEADKRGGSMMPKKAEDINISKPKKKKGSGEIWTFDLRAMKDVGIVEDLVERAAREAYNKYLLVDSKSKKVVIPLPPLIPLPLLTAITTTIFTHFQPPTITYFPSPVLSTVSAGLRSALVLDIGWHETVVTPVYELQGLEGTLSLNRTKRGGKLLRRKTAQVLEKLLEEKGIEGQQITEEMLDEVVGRVVWCDNYAERQREKAGEVDTSQFRPKDGTILIPLETATSPKPISINIPFTTLSKPPELTFFDRTSSPEDEGDVDEADEDDLPLPMLLYKTLRESPIDVRAACMARIVIVGQTASIPGLKMRIIDELKAIVQAKGGWHNIKSSKVDFHALRRKSATLSVLDPNSPKLQASTSIPLPPPSPDSSPGARTNSEVATSPQVETVAGENENAPEQDAALVEPQSPVSQTSDVRSFSGGEQEKENIQERRYPAKFKEKEIKPSVPPGTIRGVKSLGAWAGGSILAGARVKGVIEVERDKFLAAVAQGGTGFPLGIVI